MKPSRRLFAVVFAAQAALILAIAVLTALLYRQQALLEASRDVEMRSYLLADELRQSSDDLTRMARSFVVTGDPELEREYHAVLDIRDGKRPRPIAYEGGIYWDLATRGGARPQPDGEAVSLHELIVREGFTPDELAKLDEAEVRSNELVKTELAAMDVVRGGPADRERAIRMLDDGAYHAAKAAIMRPIDDFYRLFRARTAGAVAAAHARSQWLLGVLFALVIATLVTFTISFVALERQLARREAMQDVQARADARFRALVANLEDLVFSTDAAGRLLYVSPAAERIYGRSSDELRGRLFADVVHPDDLAAVKTAFERTLAGEVVPIEFRGVDARGGMHHLRATSRVRVEDGLVAGVDGVIIETTALREAERARRESEALLRAAFSVMPAAIAIADAADGLRFLEVNDAFEQMTGHRRDEAVGTTAAALGLYVDPSQRVEVLRRMAEEGGVRNLPHEIRRKDGGAVTALLSIATFESVGKRYAITVSLDVTEQRKAELELEQRLRFETLLGDLAGRLIHVDDDRLEEVITYAQRRICETYELDRSSVMQPRDGDGKIEVTQLFPDEVAIARRGAITEDHFPWSLAELRRTGAPVVVPDVAAMPPEAALDRASYQRIGITSALNVPWRDDDGTLHGVMSFSTLRGRVLTASEIRQVATLAQMVLVAVGRARERRTVARGQERNRVLTEILDEAPVGVMVFDRQGAVLYANHHASAMHGYAPDEYARTTRSDLLPVDERATGDERLAGVFERGDDGFAIWHVKKDGARFRVQVRARRTRWGEQEAVLSVQTDLTERDAAEANIRKLSQAVEQSPESIVILDLAHRIEYANEAFLRSTGSARADVLGRDLAALPSSRTTDETFADIWAAVARGETWHGDLHGARADGTASVERTIVAPLRQRDDTITHYLLIKADITETEELRKARDAADAANQAKSRFLANMSHEIRTPMNAVLGFASLLLRDPSLTANQRRQLETINRAGDHLMSLIDGILQLAKVESGHEAVIERDFDLWSFADDLEVLFRARATDKGLTLAFDRDPSVPRFVRTDDGKLRQILSNLLGNAIKFTSAGTVTVRLRTTGAGGPRRLRVEVEDSGAGIGADEMAQLFQKFEQTASGRASKQGTGLGLAISLELVRLLGGTIGVESAPGKGSVFHFELPVAEITELDAIVRGEARPTLRLAPDQGPRRVLVADDIEDNRTLLVSLLDLVGFETRACADGAQAVAEYEAWRPHLILMDLRMPVMDGIEATRRIRAAPGGDAIAVICVSASAFPDEERTAIDMGADRFLRKPVREAALLAEIGTLLGVVYVDARDAEPAEPLTALAVARLPAELRRALLDATRRADLDAMLGVLDAAATHDARLATALRELAERFAYKRVLELLEAS